MYYKKTDILQISGNILKYFYFFVANTDNYLFTIYLSH